MKGAHMRELVFRLGMAAVLLAACDGSSKTTPGPGHDGSSTIPGPDASTGACANLACLKQAEDLMFGCAGSATCILQEDLTATPTSGSQCYDNGVKILATLQTTPGSTSYQMTYTYKVKKNDALCYTRTIVSGSLLTDGGLVYGIDTTLQDAAGETLETAHLDENNVATVTCPGGAPTVFTDSCGYSTLAVDGAYATLGSSPPTCTVGTCSF
jgi:hypothetical protein